MKDTFFSIEVQEQITIAIVDYISLNKDIFWHTLISLKDRTEMICRVNIKEYGSQITSYIFLFKISPYNIHLNIAQHTCIQNIRQYFF